MAAAEVDGQDASDFEEDDQEGDLSKRSPSDSDVLARLTPTVGACFLAPAEGSAGKTGSDEDAGGEENGQRDSKRQRKIPPPPLPSPPPLQLVPRYCSKDDCRASLCAAGNPIKLKVDSARRLQITCRKCSRQQDPAHAGTERRFIPVGSVVWRLNKQGAREFAVVRHFAQNKGLHTSAWHLQLLSSVLELPMSGAEEAGVKFEFPLHGKPIFRLTRDHKDIVCKSFAAQWARGEAGVLGSLPQLFYTTDGTFDHLTVPPPESCPSFTCCTGCSCLNPWAAHADCEPTHHGCRPWGLGHFSAEVAADSSSCLYRGVQYAVGALAWLAPPGAPEVDAELDLVRIQGFRRPLLDDSQDSQLQSPGWCPGREPQVRVRYERYSRTDSLQGYTYSNSDQQAECSVDRLRGLADPERDAPGSRVMEAAADGGQGSCVAAPLETAAGVNGSSGDVGGCSGDTPSGGDAGAALSWQSDASGSRAEQDDASSTPATCSLQGCVDSLQGAGASGQQCNSCGIEICDIFCGFGGLSLGLLQALPGAEVKWACDMFEAALKTYKACHPGAETFLQDVCSFLDAIRAKDECYPPTGWKAGQPLRILIGGPPCQGFSKANKQSPAERALKNILVALFLSVLDELGWPYAIMENVAGLLSVETTIQRIQQAAVSMGYQCAFRVLNAGSYGTAQHRRRVIVIFAKHGLPMPAFPNPSHVFSGAGGYAEDGSCTLAARREHALRAIPSIWHANVVVPQHAPLPALTARCVIGDLPCQDGAEAYDKPASSHYAACMRQGGLAAAGAQLHNHVTWDLEEGSQQRIRLIPKAGQAPPEGQARWAGACSVPVGPFYPARSGNWLDLPRGLLQKGLAGVLHLADPSEKRQKLAKLAGIYARLTWPSHFASVLTRPSLYSDTTSTFLHPEADRPLTVREAARVQGVPDSVVFQGTERECYKQVGNAVPVPLARALGYALLTALRQHSGLP